MWLWGDGGMGGQTRAGILLLSCRLHKYKYRLDFCLSIKGMAGKEEKCITFLRWTQKLFDLFEKEVQTLAFRRIAFCQQVLYTVGMDYRQGSHTK